MKAQPSRWADRLAFLLTGIGTALPGATLPAVLHQFHLSDSAGGMLLLASWGGSTSGALLARGRLKLRAALGLALAAAALLTLSLQSLLRPSLLFAIYGMGLGLTMTAISLLCSRQAASAARAQVELNRLNLLWAVGAFVTPALALHSLRLLAFGWIFEAIAGVFLVCGLFLIFGSSASASPDQSEKALQARAQPWAPASLCLFAAASVGLESAVGSWLTTYAQRNSVGVVTAVSANTAFWFGLLLSRGLHSVPAWDWWHTRQVRSGHLVATVAAVTLLLAAPWAAVLPFAGFLCGFGLGPLYPYLLSVSLPRFRSLPVFVTAGVGASLVPYLTGIVSSWASSLRFGMAVPAATAIVLVLEAVWMERFDRGGTRFDRETTLP